MCAETTQCPRCGHDQTEAPADAEGVERCPECDAKRDVHSPTAQELLEREEAYVSHAIDETIERELSRRHDDQGKPEQ
ncbi:hypothetical protein QO259_05300 [Salinicola sp. JS01]|uniref:hypothetical protein n=1 Tax=Salinicola sp. JS01 TaxID=3050071 RepID=UPI00255B681C|nr:hypothetical protein [Salinicola sp. JS01]WIX34085.1 hypothetical protein QO259_05300 [Salinicola sp. JS01]